MAVLAAAGDGSQADDMKRVVQIDRELDEAYRVAQQASHSGFPLDVTTYLKQTAARLKERNMRLARWGADVLLTDDALNQQLLSELRRIDSCAMMRNPSETIRPGLV